MTISEELDFYVENINYVSSKINYWLIRTQSGDLYENFRSNSIIALGHNSVPLSLLNKVSEEFGNNRKGIVKAIKNQVLKVHKEQNTEVTGLGMPNATLISNQIYKFVYEIKKGDIVIIPSKNSDYTSFGEVSESFISSYSQEELSKLDLNFFLIKKVKWLKEFTRTSLDPSLYRVFTAHQAVNNVGVYKEQIQRSIKDFFVLENEAHYVLNVGKESNIPAKELFSLGYDLIDFIDGFSKEYGLDIDSKDIQVTINLNSPGPIDLKSGTYKVILMAGLIITMFGGKLTLPCLKLETPGFLPEITKALLDYQEKRQTMAFREQDQEIKVSKEKFALYQKILEIKESEDIKKIIIKDILPPPLGIEVHAIDEE